MTKVVALTRLTVFDKDFNMYEGIEELFTNLHDEGHTILVVSHKRSHINLMKEIFKDKFSFVIYVNYRNKIKEVANEENASDFILVGSSDEDLILAANKRILILNPGWSVKQDDKPARYGITLDTPYKLLEAIRIIENQSNWYFELDVDQDTKVLALTSANTFNRDVIKTEKEILEGFESLLKAGDRRYFNTLYFHLISGIMKNPLLRNVEVWGVFPSSSGNTNKEIEELKERCRYLTNKRMNEPLFLRHTAVSKSHHTPHDIRLGQGCKKHFESIIMNPYYKKRIKDKVVCVIDDYTTNGISFETARNLLFQAGAKKVIFLALGRYKKGMNGVYQHEVYQIEGDIFNKGYKYSLNSKINLSGKYNSAARNEVRRIHDILNN